jgi:tetratricopeptide (TPR) repeat protein
MDKEALLNGYFDHTLSEIELIAFNKLLENDASFAEELAFRKNLQNSIHIHERARIKASIKQFETTIKKQPILRKYFTWTAAAITITFMLIAVYQYTQNPKPETLFQEYYSGYPNIIAPTERSSNNSDSLTQTAFAAYDQQAFKEALEGFKILEAQQKTDYTSLYMGICYLELKNSVAAIKILEKAVALNNTYSLTAKWYLALAYLQNDQPQLALEILKQYAVLEEPFKQEAKKLYNKLK